MLRNLYAAIDGALFGIQQIESVCPPSNKSSPGELESQAYVEARSVEQCIRQLRSRVENITQMAHNLDQEIKRNQFFRAASTAAVSSQHPTAQQKPSQDRPTFGDRKPTGILPPLIMAEYATQNTTRDEEDLYYHPPLHVLDTSNKPPPLFPALDLSAEYEAVIERRLKRTLSQHESERDARSRTSLPKRRKSERDYRDERFRGRAQPVGNYGNTLFEPVLQLFRL